MFGNLVESSSHKGDYARRSSFFLATLVAYALVFLAIGVGGIYGPYESGSRDGRVRKAHWIWICPEPFVRKVFAAMMPWLGQRRIARARELGLLDRPV